VIARAQTLPAVEPPVLHVRCLGRVEYEPVWRDMQAFTAARTSATPDELWFLEHPPVYTLGRNGKPEHLIEPGAIPVLPVDRGGQVTYHGPGQLVVYTLLDLVRRGLGVQSLVRLLEQAVIDLLADCAIVARRRAGAPGVYVEDRKIAALGLRVRQGRTFHGLSLNVDMDLEPFTRINPCGMPGLKVTQLADLGIALGLDEAAGRLRRHLERLLDDTAHE